MRFRTQINRGSLLLILSILCVWTAAAQVTQTPATPVVPTSTAPGNVRGRIVLPSGAFLSIRTRITLETFRGDKMTTFTDNQGQFQFNGLPPGSYRVVIEGDKDRFETTEQTFEVLRGAPSVLNIVLKEKNPERKLKQPAKTVSLAEIDTEIPNDAKREFDRATKANREGKSGDAIAHLRKAITLYPKYLMALNDLGVRLLEQKKLDEAEKEFVRAIEIDPKAFNPQLNLGITLVLGEKFADAARTLEQALSIKPDSPSGRLYLGLALGSLNDLSGAVREFKKAHELGGPAYAIAQFNLGLIYQRRDERQEAIKAFETYLRETPGAANAAEVKNIIETLRQEGSGNQDYKI